MSVTLRQAYAGYAAGAVVTLPADTESALVAQGLADALGPGTSSTVRATILTQGGNTAVFDAGGVGAAVAPAGPTMVPCISLKGWATAGASTSNEWLSLTEIFLPAYMTARGISVLNGAVVGTDNILVALYNSAGYLVANSPPAGEISAGANIFQDINFVTPMPCFPGRYFTAVQCSGTTALTRKLTGADSPNVLCETFNIPFGTIPSQVTVPTTFNNDAGAITMLYA